MAKLYLPAQYGAHRSYSGSYTGVKIEGFSKRRVLSLTRSSRRERVGFTLISKFGLCYCPSVLRDVVPKGLMSSLQILQFH